ncbi:ComEC/Rec2 family competence protein [Aquibacillus rhizosphaerae]|uniref:ComEC/Rec2 family competence protein n=1 Tax=Aquibacillus rhizosphaerae TaxID=3051431 RepID=A0ABT7L7K7_9BACI|nr:ComEC/Rec2 family competence protein [Aquibacillus sp. LR5S19]MDL4841845.1 ComEC/Rec2 family competence protein [Aquibacillus sp. LR5S19]
MLEGNITIKVLAWIFLVVLVVFSPLREVHGSNTENGQQLQVHFIDVGQGDSMLVETPNGKKVLIDGGPPSSSDKLVKYLKQEGIRDIDLVVATHPDIDHIGGLVEVLESFEVDLILDSGKLHHTETYFRYLQQIKQQNIPVKIARKNDVKQLDKDITLKVLNSFGFLKNNNESSLVFLLNYKQIDFLLMSDVENKQELEMIEDYDIHAEILKVGHHGSDTSSSLSFLKEVKPEKAILSYSINNDYGHPVKTTIDKLLDVGATIYSTAKSGDIVIRTDGYFYHVDVAGKDRIISREIS